MYLLSLLSRHEIDMTAAFFIRDDYPKIDYGIILRGAI